MELKGCLVLRSILRQDYGQTTTETLLMLPLYLGVVFGLIQVLQLGYALIVVNYAASSIARQEVRADLAHRRSAPGTSARQGALISLGEPFTQQYKQPNGTLQKLVLGGMWEPFVRGCIQMDSPVTGTLKVWTSARVTALPIIGAFLGSERVWYDKYKSPSLDPYNCLENDALGPLYFTRDDGPIYFTVRGKASVRLNYGSR